MSKPKEYRSMSKNKLSTKATEVYNTLLELNWSEPYLTLEHIQAATGLGLSLIHI